jgi:serine phosphatase RsbU (regulator of sigma subunit)
MFGKERIKKIVQNNSESRSEEILDAIFKATKQFQGKDEFEDDATMVVIKAVGDL